MNAAAISRRRQFFRLLKFCILVYLGVLLVLMFFENRLVYFPRSADEEWIAPPSTDIRDVELVSADGTKLHAWWCPAPGATSALLYLHGNAGNLSSRGSSVLKLRQALGISVLIIDYPGYGKSGGRPSELGCYHAADAGYDWLTTEQNIAPRDILVFGVSLGGGVAVDLASRKECGGLILVKTFTSLPEVGAKLYPWLPVRWVMRNRFNSAAKIADCRCPVFITHGVTDELIPYALGQELFKLAKDPKEFFSMPGVGHNDPLTEPMFTALTTFLQKHRK